MKDEKIIDKCIEALKKYPHYNGSELVSLYVDFGLSQERALEVAKTLKRYSRSQAVK